MRRFHHYGPSLVVLATAAIVLLAGPAAVREITFAQTRTRAIEASARLAGPNILEEINAAQRDVATMVEPSVVHIAAQRIIRRGERIRTLPAASGSGWVWDEDGHVVTNYHVVRDADRIEVQTNSGGLRTAEVVGYDPQTDIAVLRIDPDRVIPAVRARLVDRGLGVVDEVQQGDLVFAFGSPFDFRFSMSSGVVSGLGRTANVIRPVRGNPGYENFIQVDAAINPGNSGGPLTNHRGEVIGMNTAIATNREGGREDEGQFGGIGLAIPLSMIEPVVSQIIETGVVTKGFLGVGQASLDDDETRRRLAARGFVGNGVLLGSVEPGSPASRAGVRPEDVIVAVNGQRIQNWSQFRSIISSTLPGEATRLRVWRPRAGAMGGDELDIDVVLGELGSFQANRSMTPERARQILAAFGFAEVATATGDRIEALGAADRRGVIIEAFVPDSPLSYDLPVGTIIVELAGTPIGDLEDLVDRLGRLDPRRSPRAGVVLPDGTMQQIVLTLR